jgi:SAM-dependent methyltransferase
VKLELLDLVCCAACSGSLAVVADEEVAGEIESGLLRCHDCGQVYPVRAGMPHLYIDDESWAPKSQEAAGWVSLHQEKGIYEQGEDAVDLQIPYYPEEPWSNVAPSFDLALKSLALDGSETVLDLGAGRGWAAKHFALRGCRVVALDVTDDEHVGLGRGRVLMRHAATYFERSIGDGERLPFRPGSFDIVFCAAALHHTSDLALFLRNVARVLRPGGLLCAINEPSISILIDEKKALAGSDDELRHGINERRPDLAGYLSSLSKAGFAIEKVASPPFRTLSLDELRDHARNRGVIWSKPQLTAALRTAWRVANFSALRAYGLLRGAWPLRTTLGGDERQQLEQLLLLWIGGELFFVARKCATT